ncbi:histone acetylation protein-domain-containing protein [Lipomyces arxii]|uniref:histone acetylation protein-domain-containing protein n=1 Tax=Lipomyces arxii TaxID=56418 RepID=UPI0034CFC17D
MVVSNFWNERLSGCLPAVEGSFILNHISTKPQKKSLTIDPLRKKKEQEPLSNSASHLVTLSYNGIHIFALELMVFSACSVSVGEFSKYNGRNNDIDVTTIFIAKADSTGYFSQRNKSHAKLDLAKITAKILETFVQIVSRPDIPSRICLFARAQPQYIFPGSAKNDKKHVLSDKQLIKWWLKVLTFLVPTAFSKVHNARLHIPGAELSDVRNFFILDPETKQTIWQEGDIFCSNGDRESELALSHVPNFPDDPKSRFLDVLETEGRDCTMTVNKFFIELQMRQEFLLGFVTAIIGIEGMAKVDSNNQKSTAFPCAVVDNRAYIRIHDMIVTSDYSTELLAANSTKAFNSNMPRNSSFTIGGSLVFTADTPKVTVTAIPHVNVIGGLLVKKRAKRAVIQSTSHVDAQPEKQQLEQESKRPRL